MFYGGYRKSCWSNAVYVLSFEDEEENVTKMDDTVDMEDSVDRKDKVDEEKSSPKKKMKHVNRKEKDQSPRPCKRVRSCSSVNNNNASLLNEMKRLYENTSKQTRKDWEINRQDILSAIKLSDEEKKIAEFESSARRAELLRAEKLIQELSKEKFVFKERLMHAERRLKESQEREKELRSYHEKLDRALSSTTAMTETVKELSTLRASYMKVCAERDTEKRLKDNLIQENRNLRVELESLNRTNTERKRKLEKFYQEY